MQRPQTVLNVATLATLATLARSHCISRQLPQGIAVGSAGAEAEDVGVLTGMTRVPPHRW
jgi:uncharacterized ferredoxin-like protein